MSHPLAAVSEVVKKSDAQTSPVFARRLLDCVAKVRWLKSSPGFRLHTMETQWDGISPKGELLLNPLLVKALGHCVDFVIFHALCPWGCQEQCPLTLRRFFAEESVPDS